MAGHKKVTHHKKHSAAKHPRRVSPDADPSTQETISFTSKEFPHHAKDALWYVGIGLLVIAGLSVTLKSHDYLLALVVVAAGLATFRLASAHPRSRQISINQRGVTWGDRFFPYHHFRSFWIAKAGDQLNLYLEGINFTPVIHVLLPVTQAEITVAYLNDFLPWHTHKSEPLADRFARLLRL